ncbi:MAG: YfhO family protein [Vampirovibrionales bacterium]|nr:YfhO family protein [Vampirovibrionales bacterium]
MKRQSASGKNTQHILSGRSSARFGQGFWQWLDRHALWLLPLLLWLAFWWPVVLGQSQLFARDLTFYAIPLKSYMMERISQGEFPFWTERISTGTPYFAELSHQLLYPLNLLYGLAYAVIPGALSAKAVQGISWQIVLEHLLGFWTMAFLARTLGFSKWTAIWICLAYGFSGYVLGISDNINYHGAVAWVPLALAYFLRGLFTLCRKVEENASGPSVGLVSWRWLLWQSGLSAAAMSLMLLAGDTFNTLFLGMFSSSVIVSLSIFWLLRFKTKAIPALVQVFVHFGLSFGLVFIICAVQILPSHELMQYSVREDMLHYDEVTLWSFPIERLVEWVVPYFYGSRFPEPHFIGMFLYPAFREPWADSVYVGLISFFLAVLGVFFSSSKTKWLWLWMIVLGLLLALGANAFYYPWLSEALPILKTQRYLEKFMFWPSLAFPLLAGLGIQAFDIWVARVSEGFSQKSMVLRIMVSLGILVGLGVLCIQLPAQLWIWPHYFERSVDWGAHFYERGLHVMGLYWHWVVLMVPVIATLWLHRAFATPFLMGLLVLGILDLAVIHYPHVPTAPSALLRDRPSPVAAKALDSVIFKSPQIPNSFNVAGSDLQQPTGNVRIYYDDMTEMQESRDDSRVFQKIADAYHFPYVSDSYFFHWVYRVTYNQERMLFNYGIAYQVAYQNGRFAPLQLKLHKRSDVVLTQNLPQYLPEQGSVQFVITPVHPVNAVWERSGYREIFRDPGYNLRILAVENTLPRAYFSPNPIWNTEPLNVYLAITQTLRSKKLEEWVELSPPETVQHPTRQETRFPKNWQPLLKSKIELSKNKAEEIALKVTSPYPLPVPLVLSESWFPGWQAVLDQKTRLPVYLANHRYLAVMIPPGTHRVQFEYHPTRFIPGLSISLAGLLWLLVSYGLYRHRIKTS